MGRKVDAYDSNSGAKLPYKVPEKWFDVFSNLRKTPIQKARESAKAAEKKEG